jgi:hypothetical protein
VIVLRLLDERRAVESEPGDTVETVSPLVERAGRRLAE